MKRHQRGVSLLLVGVMLILVVGAILAFLALFGTAHGAGSIYDTQARLANAQAALEQFASGSGRLPCPANPTLDTGDADPNAASATCNSPAGTIPWRTIGLRREDGLDSWGWKISYRVYTGAAGSLTQTNGASMVLCDTNVPATWNPGVGPGGVCRAVGGYYTRDADYMNGKGLTVTDFGATRNDVAYVLISHGPSGLGAYTAAGVQKSSPANASELSNMAAAGQFYAQPASSPDVAADDVSHFDDLIAYRSLSDFMTRANLAARDWPDPAGGLADVVANAATVSAALGQAAVYGDTGQQRLVLANAAVSAQSGGTAEDVGFNVLNATEGFGGGGGAALSSANSEVLHIDFNTNAQSFAITIDGFGCRPTSGGCTDFDSVQFTFNKDGAAVAGPITKLACNPGNGLASFSIDVGTDFNSVDVAPEPSVPNGVATAIYVNEFKNCAATCVTSYDTGSGPGGNHCP